MLSHILIGPMLDGTYAVAYPNLQNTLLAHGSRCAQGECNAGPGIRTT